MSELYAVSTQEVQHVQHISRAAAVLHLRLQGLLVTCILAALKDQHNCTHKCIMEETARKLENTPLFAGTHILLELACKDI